MNKLLVLTPGYPYQDNNNFIFIKNFVEELRTNDIEVIVVAPISLTKTIYKKEKFPPIHYHEGSLTILRPRYFSFSNLTLFGFNLSNVFMNFAIYRIARKKEFDKIYSHFWTQLMSAYLLSNGKEVFVLVGESEISIQKMYPERILRAFLISITGFIAVSKKNLNDSLKLPIHKALKKIVIPNAVNTKIFYPKKIIREELGFKAEHFIIGFIGSDEPRKGLYNLYLALKKLQNPNILLVLIGNFKDSIYLDKDFIKIIGPIKHDLICDYLSVIDVYCHTSIAEGSSNAILEALACGKAVIASKESFNDDILSDEYSFRIDVHSIDEIYNTIKYCYNNPSELTNRGLFALKFSAKNTIEHRISKILEFIDL